MEKHLYKELSSQAANGGTKAFAKLYEAVYQPMYYTAYFSLYDNTEAVNIIRRTVREGFNAIGRLHTEKAFEMFMLKTLCSHIKASNKGKEPVQRERSERFDIMTEFSRLTEQERMVTCLYVVGKYTPDEISQFMGISKGAVRKLIKKTVESFSLD
ncbi:MAG: RNA polymerase sigma factor [Oscillospiraceae bacterium]